MILLDINCFPGTRNALPIIENTQFEMPFALLVVAILLFVFIKNKLQKSRGEFIEFNNFENVVFEHDVLMQNKKSW